MCPETACTVNFLFPMTLLTTAPKSSARLETRSMRDNPNHHLWRNHGYWWCHITIKPPHAPTIRKRFSLKTHDVEIARLRRDRIMEAIQTSHVIL